MDDVYVNMSLRTFKKHTYDVLHIQDMDKNCFLSYIIQVLIFGDFLTLGGYRHGKKS